MTVSNVEKDFDALTLTLTAEFDAPVERVWQLWADPRQLERWWGPPTYPATVEEHDLSPGGTVTYFMTGREDDTHRGMWRIESLEPPRVLEFVDSFCHQDGSPNPDLPGTRSRMELIETEGGTRMELRAIFESREQMKQLDDMGMTEGLTSAIGQMDALLTG